MSASAWIWPVVLLAGVTLLTVGLVLLRRASRVPGRAPGVDAETRPTSPARAVLDARLARGEIDADEHARRAEVLDEQ